MEYPLDFIYKITRMADKEFTDEQMIHTYVGMCMAMLLDKEEYLFSIYKQSLDDAISEYYAERTGLSFDTWEDGDPALPHQEYFNNFLKRISNTIKKYED